MHGGVTVRRLVIRVLGLQGARAAAGRHSTRRSVRTCGTNKQLSPNSRGVRMLQANTHYLTTQSLIAANTHLDSAHIVVWGLQADDLLLAVAGPRNLTPLPLTVPYSLQEEGDIAVLGAQKGHQHAPHANIKSRLDNGGPTLVLTKASVRPTELAAVRHSPRNPLQLCACDTILHSHLQHPLLYRLQPTVRLQQLPPGGMRRQRVHLSGRVRAQSSEGFHTSGFRVGTGSTPATHRAGGTSNASLMWVC